MTLSASLRPTFILAILSASLAGCAGSAGREEGPPVAPAVTLENHDQLAKDVNAGAGSLGKGAPGVGKGVPAGGPTGLMPPRR